MKMLKNLEEVKEAIESKPIDENQVKSIHKLNEKLSD